MIPASHKPSRVVSVTSLIGLVGLVASLILGLGGGYGTISSLWNLHFALAATSVNLSSAANFAVLAGSAITASTPSSVNGDVGLSPSAGSNITGLTPVQVVGTVYAVDATGPAGASGNNPALVNGAKNDLVTAYDAAAAQVPAVQVGDLGGVTLTPGIYEDNNSPDSLAISAGTKILTLDAQGDPNAVFILKSGSTLTTAAGSEVRLVNGAQACNVSWQVTSSATLGTNTIFKGNILALVTITDNGGSNVEGRLLARNGAVTLNNTNLTRATCASAPVVPPVVAPPVSSSQSTINVLKVVINDNGGTKVVADFSLFVNGTPVVSGVTNSFGTAGGVFTVTETSDSNYARTFSGDCNASGVVNLSPGGNMSCIVTNNDIPASVSMLLVSPPVSVAPTFSVPPVIVAAPGFPNTGLPPEGGSTTENILILLGLVLASFIVARKYRVI